MTDMADPNATFNQQLRSDARRGQVTVGQPAEPPGSSVREQLEDAQSELTEAEAAGRHSAPPPTTAGASSTCSRGSGSAPRKSASTTRPSRRARSTSQPGSAARRNRSRT